MTTQAYQTLTADEQIFKDLVWTPAILAAEKALETYVPFFALPIIRTLQEALINVLSDWIFANMILFVDVEAIQLVNSMHQSAYDKASIQLKVIAIDHGTNSDEYIQARNEALVALSQFTQLGK